MTLIEKFESIIKWFSENYKGKTRVLEVVLSTEYINKIENLINVKLPPDFFEIYSKYNGEKGDGVGSFMGHVFLSLDELYSELELNKKHSKSENRLVYNLE